jgi:hypothetical protein
LFSSAGDDSQPLSTDNLAIIELPSKHTFAAIGVLDNKNEQLAGPGDKRIYSRNENGERVAQIWLKSDGSMINENDNVTIETAADGTVTSTNPLSVVTQKADGEISMTNNAGGAIRILPSGIINLNGVTIDLTGAIVSPTSVAAASVAAGTLTIGGIPLAPNHNHDYIDSVGAAGTPTTKTTDAPN